jgi:hypothetical protein
MDPSHDAVRPLLPATTPEQAAAILGAMRAVAETGGAASDADHRTLVAAARFIFGQQAPANPDGIALVTPEALRTALAGTDLADNAIRFITVMAFIDGVLDKAKIAAVLAYAGVLGIHERYLDEIADAARDRLQEALADMTRSNMESITGAKWAGGDVNRWLLPYRGEAADPALAARFAALGGLPPDSFGHVLWQHFRDNAYAFPGEPDGLNAAFSLPHDSVHVLTGYNTKARGEILTSTFTAAMHRSYPMAGHVLPVILSWHIGQQINAVAGKASGALDPEEFWRAWAAGAAMSGDTFARNWDFWSVADVPLAALRERCSLPRGGLAAGRAGVA